MAKGKKKDKKAKKAKGASRDVDVLGVIDVARPERVLVLDPGEHSKLPLVARTTCEIEFDNEDDLLACIDALRESDAALKLRPGSLKMWEWNRTFREGDTIIFGVLWYDLAFFESRKDAFKDDSHRSYYKRFHASPDRFKVTHEVLAR